MSSPTNPDADPLAGLVSNFRQATNETSQPGSEVGIPRISCRCHLPDEMAWALDIIFVSDLDVPDDTMPEWKAYLRVSAHDVPRLMREGFYWSEVNVDQERGEYASYPREENPSLPRFCRTYYLDDLEDDPQWMAQLTVHSHELHVLSKFRLRDLRVEDILSAMAFRPRSHRVYYYHARKPQHCINAIYDNMPLKGWWPWPKEEEAAGETEDETDNEAEV
ncbi:hypothetical protein LRP88_09042 [Fusarium phalaenopsidis]|nr:hypothetical protein NCS56_00171400 [Fusarium sp. Ph1]